MTLSTAPFESRMRISPPRKQAWPFAISNIVDHAKFYSRLHDAVIRVYDGAGNVFRTLLQISPTGRLSRKTRSGLITRDYAFVVGIHEIRDKPSDLTIKRSPAYTVHKLKVHVLSGERIACGTV